MVEEGIADSAQEQVPSRGRLSSPVLIGRELELRLLLGAITSPPALAVVRGEAGIGKSRVVREILKDERVVHRCVLVGRCHRLRDPFPLGPAIEALRGGGGRLGGRSLSPLVGALRPLLPELSGSLPAEPAPLADPRAQRHRIFRALRELLEALGPAVCVLEDLHWADGGTLELLSFLLSDPPAELALVVTYRGDELDPSHPLFAVDACAGSQISRATTDLGPLSSDEVRALAAALLDSEQVAPDLASYLHARTGGIPFAVEEVVGLLYERGHGSVKGSWTQGELDQLEVPDAIRHSVLQRIRPLSGDARTVAASAAVLARPAGEHLLRKVAALPAPRARRGLITALDAGLLEEQGRALYGFRHALATSAVHEDIPAPQGQRLHLRAARALESAPEPRPFAQIAHHFKEAGRPRQWVRYAEAAAEAAHSIADDRSAAEILEDALQAPCLSRAARVRMAIALGNAALYSPLPQTAIPPLERALNEEGLGAGVRGELRFSLARLRWHAGQTACWREEMLRAVEELQRRPELAARAMVNLALPRLPHGPHSDIRERLSWLRRAEQVAVRTDDSVAHIAVSAQRAAILLSIGDSAGWDAAAEIPADAGSVDAKLQLLRGFSSCSQAALDLGYYCRAKWFLAQAQRIQDGLGHVWFEPLLRYAEARLDWMMGRWQGLEPRMRELSELHGTPYVALHAKIILAWLLFRGGKLEEAKTAIESAREDARTMGWSSGPPAGNVMLAEIHLAEGRPEAGRESATQAMEEVLACESLWLGQISVFSEAVQTLVACGDQARAGEFVRVLATRVSGRDAPAAKAALSSCRGSLVEADGRPEAAARFFGQAERIWSELPAPYDAARARERRGRCLLALNDRQGGDLLVSARDDLQALGARWDAARLQAELKARGLTPASRGRRGRNGYGGQLSPREAEVARLAGMGKTNREIAETLVISPHTAAHHVSAVLRKLAVPSRHALARLKGELEQDS